VTEWHGGLVCFVRGVFGDSGDGEAFLVDGIVPFFRGLKQARVNWSKIPYAELPLEGADGLDVEDDLRPQLHVRSAAEVND
jgi:hypothetical protein